MSVSKMKRFASFRHKRETNNEFQFPDGIHFRREIPLRRVRRGSVDHEKDALSASTKRKSRSMEDVLSVNMSSMIAELKERLHLQGRARSTDDGLKSTSASVEDIPGELEIRRTSSAHQLRQNQNRARTCFLYSEQRRLQGLLLTVVKEGPIDRVKVLPPGTKRAPRHWRYRYALLTDKALFFAENSDVLLSMKSGGHGGESLQDRVDLRQGAKVTRDTGTHSSKKNVIVVTGADGCTALIQNDNTDKSDAWWNALCDVIAQHTADHIGITRGDDPDDDDAAKRSLLSKFFKRRPTMESLMDKGIYKDEPMFGSTLERLYEASGKKRPVPEFVERCIAILDAPPHVNSVGLYRTSGNLSQIQGLRLQVDQNKMRILDEQSDTDVLAGSLKLFFRELRIPLIPHQVYVKLAAALEQQNNVKSALNTLTVPHARTLAALCKHLLNVTKHEHENQMNVANVAIVWGPSLTWPDEKSTSELYECTSVNRVVQYLIQESASLF